MDVADQSFLFDQSMPVNQGFMPTPPYTPYSNAQTPSAHSPPYSNFSPPYSKGTPSPQSSCGYQGDSFSPYSSTATPLNDHVLPKSTVSHLPVQPMNLYTNQPPVANSIATKIGPPPQNKQAVEVRATFIPNGNSTSNLSGYTESVSLPMCPDVADVFSLSGTEFAQKAVPPSLAQAPPHVRQSVIQNTRQRYSGSTPSAGTHTASSTVEFSHRGVSDADSSISQWSQWLKGNAPAPVC
jgi:hypothetical protein